MREVVAAALRGMVHRLGCLDAAAAVIEARFGRAVSKGTLSKKLAGQLDWTICDVLALEDALGSFAVTRLMARRLAAEGASVPDDLTAGAGDIARESGEAVAAILSAEASGRAGDRARALVEIDEAIQLLEAARGALAASVLPDAARRAPDGASRAAMGGGIAAWKVSGGRGSSIMARDVRWMGRALS